MQVAATALGGRDFEGQVTKEINGKTYILIGNEQQLRAIGSGKKVIGRINKARRLARNKDSSVLLSGWTARRLLNTPVTPISPVQIPCAMLMPPTTTTVHCWDA